MPANCQPQSSPGNVEEGLSPEAFANPIQEAIAGPRLDKLEGYPIVGYLARRLLRSRRGYLPIARETRTLLNTLILATLVNLMTGLVGAMNLFACLTILLLFVDAVSIYWYGLICEAADENIVMRIANNPGRARPSDLADLRATIYEPQSRFLRFYLGATVLFAVVSSIGFLLAVRSPNASAQAVTPAQSSQESAQKQAQMMLLMQKQLGDINSTIGQADPKPVLQEVKSRLSDLNMALDKVQSRIDEQNRQVVAIGVFQDRANQSLSELQKLFLEHKSGGLPTGHDPNGASTQRSESDSADHSRIQ